MNIWIYNFFISQGIHEVKRQIPRNHDSHKPRPFDPISPVAKDISKETWLLCFDEFQVKLVFKHYNIQIYFRKTYAANQWRSQGPIL